MSDGDWQNLNTEAESARYAAIAEHIGIVGKVLDIGCGTGVLRSFLGLKPQYLGIEPSSAALAGAVVPFLFVNCAFENFYTNEKFDFIVFNESLYYCKDPEAMLMKAEGMLNPAGVIIVSIFQKKAKWLERITFRITNELTTQLTRFFFQDGKHWFWEKKIEDKWVIFIGGAV